MTHLADKVSQHSRHDAPSDVGTATGKSYLVEIDELTQGVQTSPHDAMLDLKVAHFVMESGLMAGDTSAIDQLSKAIQESDEDSEFLRLRRSYQRGMTVEDSLVS